MKKIIYIGNFSFPLGNAAGKRVYANGKILRDIGYEVIFMGTNKVIGMRTLLEETEDEFDGFKFYSFPYPKSYKDWLNYNSTFRNFINFTLKNFSLDTIEAIIYYGSPSLSLFIKNLQQFCDKNNIIIISDCVDWLTVKTNNPAFDIVKWIDTTYQKTILNKKADGVITISKFLDNYYKKTNMTVLIPPLSPFIYKELCLINDERKVIVYAGIPFRIGKKARNESDLKDRIDKIIILLCEAKDRGANFKLDIYGFTKNEYLFSLPLQSGFVNRLGDFVEFHGMKSNSEVVKEISKADFTILIRDVKRDTVAGFPTKVSESISCGTPVITNKTSDIDDYVIEENNGFFIEDNSIEKIIQILKIDSYEVLKMKSKCLETNIFYYKFYLDKMANFLSRIESKTQ